MDRETALRDDPTNLLKPILGSVIRLEGAARLETGPDNGEDDYAKLVLVISGKGAVNEDLTVVSPSSVALASGHCALFLPQR